MEQLFSKVLLLQMKSADRENRRHHIKITIELCTVTSPLHKKDLKVRLTDDSDPFFLFNLSLGEEDFQSLKNQQGLLVDFAAFPQKFIDLLELCLQEQDKEAPQFLLRLENQSSTGTSMATLSVVQTNAFKHLTHLSLKLLPGMDADVKKYLADCLKNLKDEKSSLESRLQSTEADLSQRLRQTQEALSARSSELDSLKLEWSSRISNLTAQHSNELLAERKKAVESLTEFQARVEREKHETELSYQQKLQQLEEKLAQQDSSNKELVDRKYRSESNIRELKAKLSGIEEDYHRARQELQALRKDNSSLDSGCHEREKVISQLRTKIAVLEQEVRDKDVLVEKNNTLLEAANEHKAKLEESCNQSKNRINKLESTLKSTSQQVHKGNDIIRKLQGELKTCMAKVKLKNTVTTNQEKVLQEKSQELAKCQEELKEVHFKLKQLESENKTISESYESAKKKLEESRELLKTNENVINWLNKQVNEVQLSRRPPGPYEQPSTASAGQNFKPTFNPTQPLSTSVISSIPGNLTESRFSHHSYPSRPNSVQQQIQYNPQVSRKPNLMGHHKLSPGIPAIPEELATTPVSSAPTLYANRQGKSEPVLDAKFLQPSTGRGDILSVRAPAHHSTPASQTPPTLPQPPARLSQAPAKAQMQAVNPRTTPPLMSAYFPGRRPQASV
ncbi:spindle assembly abnormal protein 6 homolog [Anneissia japonica]|uniref:spindle assembly abnormal protein 6 homolog n=1 Tax=Anneissia japonica TaxID=1529436 RepID=UPI0014258623|nr:spindle assembly abnormal protein 6 homolog [Anneissia japonica]XP_033120834.1 spindle assembly abnormal protein 6 homolog [Anneissia japonica]XP_033120835.1 spindle assembly abnormal protein 6 homolog [Anneissia japonica]XP_033120836.1 spindle assembly abnormal protein 6 homolog [Anneissia japonica]